MPLITHIGPRGTAEEIGPLRTAFPEDHPLAGVGAKLERARHHLKTLNSEMDAFLGRGPYSFVLERGRRRTEFVLRAYAAETPPLAWSAVVGDFLQNLRSALEYLAWELARAEVKHEPDRKTSFPIYVKRKKFDSDGRAKIGDLSRQAQDAIERLQPFNRSYVSSGGVVNVHAVKDLGRWYRGHPLWRLNELARRDRHQALRVVGAATWGASGSSTDELPDVREAEWKSGPFGAGSVVARWKLGRDAAASIRPEERAAPITPSVFLALDEGVPPPPSLSAIMALGRLLEHVDEKIVPRLEQFV
jgi:hypothetical protein